MGNAPPTEVELSRVRRAAAPKSDRGFALIAVIWVLAFLSLASALFARALQTHLAAARALQAKTEARQLAESGVNLAILALLQRPAADAQRPAEPAAFTCRAQERGLLDITISDEAGKIDLNTSSEALLAALITGLGVPRADAVAKAAAISDYRDADSVRGADGAENDEYTAAGRTGPKNAAFEHTGELADVLGLEAALVTRMLPYVTVYSAQDGVDPNAAPDDLLDILARGLAHGAPADLESRIATDGGRGSELPVSFLAASLRQVYAIRSFALTPSGARFVSEAVVRIAPLSEFARPLDPVKPPSEADTSLGSGPESRSRNPPAPRNPAALDYQMLDWREATPAPDAAIGAAAPC